MDSESGPEVRTPQAEIPEARVEGRKAGRINRRLAVAVAVLSVAVVALGAALVGEPGSEEVTPTRQPDTEPTTTEASAEVVALLDQRIAAMNRGDGAEAAALYAQDAVLDEIEGKRYPSGTATYTFTGRAQIQERLQGLIDAGLRLEAVGEPVQLGDLVAEPTKFLEEGGTGYGEGVLVFQISPQGTIAHQWMIGWVNRGD